MSELPQRELLHRLKRAIDIALDTGQRSAYQPLRVLLAENPHGSWSTYVQYNLGARRRQFLREQEQLAATSLQPTRSALVEETHE